MSYCRFYRNMQQLVTQFFLSKRTFIYFKTHLIRMELYNHVVNGDLIPKRYRLPLPSIEVLLLLSVKEYFY